MFRSYTNIFCGLFLLLFSPHTIVADFVKKQVLKNGLTVLVHEKHNIPKVAVQILYDVGSKHEKLDEKGIAHLLEHMVFKGTDKLSETDHGAIVRKLSGTCNGITSADWTTYVYNVPSHNWQEILPIIADCMQNCTFKDDVLSSEMKAVIQELKMYNDNYGRCLKVELEKAIFADHPYHYPVVGYKQDLIHITGKDLHAFYKKHYQPTNATLVVVGDVNANDVIALCDQHLGHIAQDEIYIKKENICLTDIASKSVTLYRDVSHPSFKYAFAIPGISQKNIVEINILEWVIGRGRGSRLYKKLVLDHELATNVSVDSWKDLFEQGLFFIHVNPKNEKNREKIEEIICAELTDLANNGLSDNEFIRAFKKTQMQYYALLESCREQAYNIGLAYLATKDENYVFSALKQLPDIVKEQTWHILKRYFRPSVMHKGYLLPLSETEKGNWLALQQASDQKDTEILSHRIRSTEVEPASYAKLINLQTATPSFIFPKSKKSELKNGLKIFQYHNDTTPQIKIILQLKANYFYDPEDKEGLSKFVAAMMIEGTETYTGQKLIDILDAHGMSLQISPGEMSMTLLESDLILGLSLLKDVLTKSLFPQERLEEVRQRLLVDIKKTFDDPASCKNILLKNIIYEGHPYSKQEYGTPVSIASISHEDLIAFYKKYISPDGARLVLVGDLHNYNVEEIIAREFGDWVGPAIEDIEYPALHPVPAGENNYPLNRDQVYLCLAQLSIERSHPDFDKYRIFDYILTGGNMPRGSRLFNLREQTGIFYAIGGSLTSYANKQPGMFQVSTIVSQDRLQEAELMLKNLIDSVVDTVTEEEFEEAKRTVINTCVDNFVSNDSTARTFLFLDRFKFSDDYYDNRAAELEKITLEEVKNAVRDILNSEKLLTVRVGRV